MFEEEKNIVFFLRKKSILKKNNSEFNCQHTIYTNCLDRVMSLNFVTQKLKTQRLEEDEDGKITRRNINTTVSFHLFNLKKNVYILLIFLYLLIQYQHANILTKVLRDRDWQTL